MKKARAAIISNKVAERKKVVSLLRNGISKEIEIDFLSHQYTNRKRVGNLTDYQLYIATSLNPNSSQQKLARTLKNEEKSHCARLLLTNVEDLVGQHKQYPKSSLVSNYLPYLENPKTNVRDIVWKEFKTWFRDNYPTFNDIIIERPNEEGSLKKETRNAIEYVRGERQMSQDLSIGVVGLGRQGMGILDKTAREKYISNIFVNSAFVERDGEGNYNPLLDSLDLSGKEREKIRGFALEELLEANPDVLIISTGEHDFDYGKCQGDRAKLTVELLKENMPKIDLILRTALEIQYKGLVVLQPNPPGHFIRYARNMGFSSHQLTSFPPDTIRYIAELYERLKGAHPELKEEDMKAMSIGEHMKGGTPVNSKCSVKGKPTIEVYPEFNNPKFQESVCKAAQGKGLDVMMSAENYGHDYRGVPERVKECLTDIAFFQKFSRYPIYSGVISLPARFTYQGDRDEANVRVYRDRRERKLIKNDEAIIKELNQDIRNLRAQTKPYLKEIVATKN